jgi:hypothetical protein
MPPTNPSPNDPRRSAAKDVLPTARRLPAAAPRPPARPQPPPAADAGFEVVGDDTGFEVVDADAGFEVVDETVTTRSAKAGTAADPGFEVIDDAPPRRKPKKAVEVDDDADDDRPRKKKGKKKKRGGVALTAEDEERERENENKIVEWGVPISLAVIGLGLAVFGAIKGLGAVGPFVAVMITVGTAVVLIPVTIAALMVIGSLVGIEYGTLGSAIRNLAAITMMVQGVLWLGMGLDLCMITFLITPVLTLAMFMTLFRLDMWEAWITVTLLDALQMGFSMLFFMVVAVALSRGMGGGPGGPDPDDDPVPAWNDPDDGDGGNWQRQNRGKRRPPNFGDDDDGF